MIADPARVCTRAVSHTSKAQFQRQLADPRRADTGDLAELGGIQRRIRVVRVHVVNGVEELSAELDLPVFVQCEVLGHPRVEVYRTWATQRALTQISEIPVGDVTAARIFRARKCRWIEPGDAIQRDPADARAAHILTGYQIRAVVVQASERTIVARGY